MTRSIAARVGRPLLGAAIAIAALGGAASADPVHGVWQTQVDDGRYAHVTMGPCGSKICGVISRSFDASGEYESPNKSKKLVFDMEPTGGGNYKGKVWRPANGKTYIGKMSLNGSQLSMSGCVAGGLICKSQTWARVK